VPASPAVAGFCCAGCATVFQLLRDGGLDRFYTLGGGAGQPVGAAPRAADMPWLEELAAQGRGPDGVVRIALDVQGIRCAACVWVLQELWRRQPGTLGIDIDPSVGRMALAWREAAEDTPREEPPLAGPTAERPAAGLSLATVRQILQGAARLGYPVGPATKDRAPRDRSLMVRLGVCSALAMNAMILAISVYAGLEDEGGMLAELFGWVSAGLATAAVVVGGPVFFRGAVQGLRQRVWHLDLPIALGISLAWAGSVWAFAAGQPAYFDSVTVFVALMVAGRFVQERAVARNRDRLLRDDGAEHLRVRRVEDGRIDVVPVRDLQAGDELVLAPGDLVPVEVLLDQDEAAFSLDWISGEAEPRRFERGGRIPAGAFQGGRAPVRAVAAEGFETSHLRQLLRVPQGDPDDVRGRGGFWRQVNRTYVIAVLGLAAIGLLAWWPVDPYRAVSVAVAILVVTCPCALGLAMPLGFHLALADLRRHGVFVRTTALLEKARHVRKVLFDKTGTLTWGGLRVTSAAMPAAPLTAGERAAVRSMVALSNHPASLAVGQWLAAEGSGAGAPEGRPAATVLASGGPGDDALTVVENPGAGLEAHLGAHVYRLGRRGFAAAADAEPRSKVPRRRGPTRATCGCRSTARRAPCSRWPRTIGRGSKTSCAAWPRSGSRST